MRKLSTFIAMAALASQVATPVFANGLVNASGPQGWQRPSDGAATMAYFRMPLGATKADNAQPRFGLMAVAPRPAGADRYALRMDMPALVDIGFTGRDLDSKWTTTLSLGDHIAWAKDPSALPPGARANLMENASVLTWVLVGAATVGAGVGIFVLIDKKK